MQKRNKLLFLILSVLLHHAHADVEIKEILTERYVEWDHPVLAVFKKHNISLYKISYSKDKTCPTFYAKFKYSLKTNAINPIDYQKVYIELLKTNYNFSYALVDQEENLKVNVSWSDKTKKSILVEKNNALSSSICKKIHDELTSIDYKKNEIL